MLSKELLKKYKCPSNFFNRDLSWIEFNRRVLQEALNPNLPLLEKIKFLAIFNSNLDEFYMIRVAGIKEQIAANVLEPTIDGYTPIEQLRLIEKALKPMLQICQELWSNDIVPSLKDNKIFILNYDEIESRDKERLREYFTKEIFPILTPLAFDPGRPFPYISNLSLNFAILVRKPNGESHFARLKIPNILPRVMSIDKILNPKHKTLTNGQFSAKYIWLGDLIKSNLDLLFPGLEIIEAHKFRITRDTDIDIQEDEADDLLKVIEENIRQRRFGAVVRLEVASTMPEFMVDTLIENLEVTREDIHITSGPLGMSDIMSLYDLPLHQMKFKPFYPVVPKAFEENDIFSLIRQRDLLIHHPYHSFTPVIDFIKQATKDPDVLAIKQTLYRVGADSPIIKALIEAAERGKQVAVLVELKARFDEEKNIYWAKELEKVGAHVVYGLVGLKTHAKMSLVVRREAEGVKRYVHLSTGNYNEMTAKMYTDLGLFTCDNDICTDVSDIFNFLTGYSKQTDYRKLIVSPINMRNTVVSLIMREIDNVKAGGEGYIILKLNAIVDPYIIACLYEASNAGVKIELIVRGICCLLPGIKGVSENISVRSIVGRYLEHSRISYFFNNGEENLYLGSADLMPRNLDRRVEVMYPVESAKIKAQLLKILKIMLKDNTQARELHNDKSYYYIDGEESKRINAQEWLMERAIKSGKTYVKNKI
jgi:polyphosphate kinase